MEVMTITQALSTAKAIADRIARKSATVLQYAVTRPGHKDPIKTEGGSKGLVSSESQAINDLVGRLLRIRKAVTAKNLSEMLEVNGRKMLVHEWLTWRREAFPLLKGHLEHLIRVVNSGRENPAQRSRTGSDTPELVEPTINLDEKGLHESLDMLKTTEENLDGALQVFNATTTVEV